MVGFRPGDALKVVVNPVQWNPDWDAPDCRETACSQLSGVWAGVTDVFELRFVAEHVVEVMTQVANEQDLDHPLVAQEFPCLYANYSVPDLSLLLDASGNQISIDQPFGNGLSKGFTSAEPWVTYQYAARTYGVGLASDQGIRTFVGCTGGPGTAQPAYYHYVRAITNFGLPPHSVVRGLSYLTLGSFDTVRAETRAVLARRPPFGVVDAPAGGQVHRYPAAGSNISVAGWVLDTTHLGQVQVSIDNQAVAALPVTTARSDVCTVYPDYDGCPLVGLSGTVSTSGLNACQHLLRVTAQDPDGNTTVLGERVIQSQ